jgi:hypothetical protein
MGRVAQPLISLTSPLHWVPRSFAFFAKGRVPRTRGQRGFEQSAQSCVGSIVAHPCEKRKDGAPSTGMAQAEITKGGPPAEPLN